MTALALKQFGGTMPLVEPRLLPEHMAEEAVNVDVSRGSLGSYMAPKSVHVFPRLWRRAYRLPSKDGTQFAWLGLESEHASVVRSPLANDTERRVYWTIPGAAAPYWTTYQRIVEGAPPYNLGIPQPSTTHQLVANPVGGTGTPLVSRSYVYTYVNAFGEESAPNLPSLVVSGPPDADWEITGLPPTAPANPAGIDYPPVTRVHLYRTITGVESGGEFFHLGIFDYDGVEHPPPPTVYHDVYADSTIIGNLTLPSEDWGNPPDKLDGLTALPGGMLVGFIGNTVHFSEVDRPHTWPAAYDQSLHYDIVGMAYWNRSLVVLTKGYPAVGAGNVPLNFIFQQIQAAEPCVHRGSIVADLLGVFYASQNGLIFLNQKGVVNQTSQTIGEDRWSRDFSAEAIMGCRHRSQYLAITPDGVSSGWILDFAEKRRGVVMLASLAGATAVWSDETTGDTFVMAGSEVYRWDDIDAAPLTYRWRSKHLFTMAPGNFGAVQIALHDRVGEVLPIAAPPLDGNDLSLSLPDGVNATFRVFAISGETRHEYTRELKKRIEIFRLPSGFLSFDWQAEIVSRVPLYSIEFASTMRELKTVPTARTTTTTATTADGMAGGATAAAKGAQSAGTY
jgi:hypothetical protein